VKAVLFLWPLRGLASSPCHQKTATSSLDYRPVALDLIMAEFYGEEEIYVAAMAVVGKIESQLKA
jgi:hypothetical protein